jgi:GntR family transcriptional regulator
MYRQIAEDLRAQIESGTLKPGQQLWTEIELRDRYGASRNTVRDAIKWLTTLGLVETRPGQGTFVVKKIDPYVTILTADPKKARREEVTQYGEVDKYDESEEGELKKRDPSYSEPQVEIQKASSDVAFRLRIPEGSQVISRHQKRYIDGTPWSLEASYYPMDLVNKGAHRLIEAEDIPEGTVRYLAELDRPQVGYRDLITVRSPSATEAMFFNVPQDGRVAVYEIFRTAFDKSGKPTRLTVTVYPTDRNQFIVIAGEVPASQRVLMMDGDDAPGGPDSGH